MHVRVRVFGKPDVIVVVESKLTKIEQFRRMVNDKLDVEPNRQRLFYGGKLLENGYTFHDYNIKLNDVIQLMPKLLPSNDDDKKETSPTKESVKPDKKEIVYTDATCQYYAIGDKIDMRDREHGAWFEGKVVRIVRDPDAPPPAPSPDDGDTTSTACADTGNSDKADSAASDKESDAENKPPVESTGESAAKKPRGIAKYFSKTTAALMKKKIVEKESMKRKPEEELLYEIKLDADEETSIFCKFKEIRPRAHRVIDPKDLKSGTTVMVNFNAEDPFETGYWYDFKVDEILILRKSRDLIGTLYLGPEGIPQDETQIKLRDKVFAIERPVPLDQRTDQYTNMMAEFDEKRSFPLNCLRCRDDEDAQCKYCGCFLCSGKEDPDKIILCDECNHGYHMGCLQPPLLEVPEEDWYCPSCRRDPNEVVAPGAAKQAKKAAKSKRDWGRGMACVGKSKSCAMPLHHFGPIPGVEVGMRWKYRIQMSECGVHRPPVSGIHGRDIDGAYSIVLSGGYEDDTDHGYEFIYTGSGGRDLSGNKRTAEQSCDQVLTRENKALARNCAVPKVCREGADAGANWRQGKPVRVMRSYKMKKHFPKYAPAEGVRYDGIYKVVKYYPAEGKSGYIVWKYLLRRDDTAQAPWEEGAKEYPIVYPDGYLEAEAEKLALKLKNGPKAKKRTLGEANPGPDAITSSPPSKRRKKAASPAAKGKQAKKPLPKRAAAKKGTKKATTPAEKVPIVRIVDLFAKAATKPAESPKSPKSPKSQESANEECLTAAERDAIKADTVNQKLWNECLAACEEKGKRGFVDQVTEVFLCIICQEVAANPVTTPCHHNFCMSCLKLAFRSTAGRSCPCCRQSLQGHEIAHNEQLRTALRAILPGYDIGKK